MSPSALSRRSGGPRSNHRLRGGIRNNLRRAARPQLRTSVSELESLSDPDADELRIGCEETLATGLLPALIDRLGRRHPRLTCEIVIADPKTLRERDLPAWNVEVAIMRTEASGHDGMFEAKTLYEDRLQIVAGVDNPWARRRKIALSDLVNERWCLPSAPKKEDRLAGLRYRCPERRLR